MSDKKISELTALTAPDGTEELVVNDSGTSKKITQTNLLSTALPLAGGTMTGTIAGFTSTGIDDNATSTAITIDASENVIINSSGVGNGILNINGATGSTEALMFQRGGTEASRVGHSVSGDLTFSMGSGVSEKVRILSSGGITFNGDTAAANALDDYETGTYTPNWAGITVGNATVNTATYTKVGNMVTVVAQFALGSTSAVTGAVGFSLPFTNSNTHSYGSGNLLDSGIGSHTANCEIGGLSTVCYFKLIGASSTYGTVVNVNTTVPFTWTTVDALTASITYQTA